MDRILRGVKGGWGRRGEASGKDRPERRFRRPHWAQRSFLCEVLSDRFFVNIAPSVVAVTSTGKPLSKQLPIGISGMRGIRASTDPLTEG